MSCPLVVSNLVSIRTDNTVGTTISDLFKSVIKAYGDAFNLEKIFEKDNALVIMEATSSTPITDLTAFCRLYAPQNLITISFESSCQSNETNSQERYRLGKCLLDLQVGLTQSLGLKYEPEIIPPIKRGHPVFNYYITSDNRVVEYDCDLTLFSQRSDHQKVSILRSPSLGNILFLDNLQNLGEKDLNYTHGLMNFGHVDYHNKEVLILGGGDGALLHELLKENPKFVTMIDIDSVVVEACRKHLRGACFDTLDNLQTEKYHVIIGDAFKHLDNYITSQKSFDIIFNDLTDIPIVSEYAGTSYLWDLIKDVLTKSLKCLKPMGKYLNHATGVGSADSLRHYEKLLKEVPFQITFTKHSKYVPSFLEEWVFYEITKMA